MRRLLLPVAAVLLAALGAALYARTSSAGASTKFRTPDAGAACRLEGASLVCSSIGSPASVALRARGLPSARHELPWWDAGTPVLQSFRHDGISCRLVGAAIVCRGAGTAIRVDRNGFAVAA